MSGQSQSSTIDECGDQPKRLWIAQSWSFAGRDRNSSSICNSTESFVKQCNYRVNCNIDLNLIREEQNAKNCDRERAFVFFKCLEGLKTCSYDLLKIKIIHFMFFFF